MRIKHLTDRLAIFEYEPGERNPVPPKVFNLRKALIDSGIPMVCNKCGKTGKLDSHHVEPVKYIKTKNGYTYQPASENHSASNGMWLCRKCHNNLHHLGRKRK